MSVRWFRSGGTVAAPDSEFPPRPAPSSRTQLAASALYNDSVRHDDAVTRTSMGKYSSPAAVSLLLFAVTFVVGGCKSAAHDSAADAQFIVDSCAATLYPAACVKLLAPSASLIRRNPRTLAQTALNLSLSTAKSTYDSLSRLRAKSAAKDKAAMADCLENIRGSVDRLSRSIAEIGRLSTDFRWHWSNAMTWTSAALTDETTCIDGFTGRSGLVKETVAKKIAGVSRVTSVALALLNRCGSTEF